ncbi:MAG: hypothetical protein ABSB99_10725 [Acidimicrobiales bacterium]|jgi:hypothetical protein
MEDETLEPVLRTHDARLGLGHFEPDITQDGAHQAICGLNFQTSISQDHKVIGLCRVPDYAEDCSDGLSLAC